MENENSYEKAIEEISVQQKYYGKWIKRIMALFIVILIIMSLCVVFDFRNRYVGYLINLVTTITFGTYFYLFYKVRKLSKTYYQTVQKQDIQDILESEYLTNGRKERHITDYKNANDQDKLFVWLKAKIEEAENKELRNRDVDENCIK
ncbi:TPA: hypothetical protein QCW96_002216 [Bacillus pacificus]|uniref:hypothetical protein n=1 Tax=Bacillus cereus group TaxID=86661 RepID=UPI003848D60D|nr:hypothetical protein [Bacillus pacificus]